MMEKTGALNGARTWPGAWGQSAARVLTRLIKLAKLRAMLGRWLDQRPGYRRNALGVRQQLPKTDVGYKKVCTYGVGDGRTEE